MTTAEERFALGVRYIEAGTRLMDRLQAELEAEGVWDDAVRRVHAEWEEDMRARFDADTEWIAEQARREGIA